MLDRHLQNATDNEAKNIMRAEKERVLKVSRELHSKSKHGTTAEMAQALGVSKSEIRKLRRDGELEIYL